MGTIFATFSASGNIPEDNDLLKTTESKPHVSEIVALMGVSKKRKIYNG